jgi:hypothetical protein
MDSPGTDSSSFYEELHAGEAPAGRIAAFDPESGRLVIELADGGAVAGLVTERTWIEDGDEAHHARRQLRKWYRLNDVRHEDDRGDAWRHGPRGEPGDLRRGAVVEDAVLILKDGRAYFAKVELTG